MDPISGTFLQHLSERQSNARLLFIKNRRSFCFTWRHILSLNDYKVFLLGCGTESLVKKLVKISF